MLILTRKLEEEIVINSNIRIKILASSDGQVKLGIDAPMDVKIYRAELFDKIKMETEEAIHKSTEKITDVSKLKVNKLKTR